MKPFGASFACDALWPSVLTPLRSAVSMHLYREESDWFPELRRSGESTMQARLSRRFREEFERYMGEQLEPSR